MFPKMDAGLGCDWWFARSGHLHYQQYRATILHETLGLCGSCDGKGWCEWYALHKKVDGKPTMSNSHVPASHQAEGRAKKERKKDRKEYVIEGTSKIIQNEDTINEFWVLRVKAIASQLILSLFIFFYLRNLFSSIWPIFNVTSLEPRFVTCQHKLGFQKNIIVKNSGSNKIDLILSIPTAIN